MMKDYRHMMRQVTLSDQKKEEIMDMLENQEAKKRRIPSVAKIALAAALAAGCLISGAVAMRQPEFIPDFTPAVKITIEKDSINFDYGRNDPHHEWPTSEPIQLKDGRLWFINGKEFTDITDIIDEETPYVGVLTDPDTGEITAFFAAGGTPEDFGHIAAARYPEGSEFHYGASGLNFQSTILTYDGVSYDFDACPDNIWEIFFKGTDDKGGTCTCYTTYKPWVITAVKELGIDWFNVEPSGTAP